MFFKKRKTPSEPVDPIYQMITWLLNNEGYSDGPDTKYSGRVDHASDSYLIARTMGPVGKDYIHLQLSSSPFGAMLMMGDAGWVTVYDGVNKYHTDWKWQEAIKEEYDEKHG